MDVYNAYLTGLVANTGREWIYDEAYLNLFLFNFISMQLYRYFIVYPL